MAKQPPSGEPPRTIPNLADFQSYASQLGFEKQLGEECWRFYSGKGWRFSSGDPLDDDDWLTILNAWQRNAAKRRKRQ